MCASLYDSNTIRYASNRYPPCDSGAMPCETLADRLRSAIKILQQQLLLTQHSSLELRHFSILSI